MKFKQENPTFPEPPSTDFDYCLRTSASAFEKFRYAYEGFPEGQGWLAGSLRESVRERIIELHPTWLG